MSQRNGAPECPKVKDLRNLIDKLAEMEVDGLSPAEEKFLLNSLDWLADHLDNRRLYHKKIQLKNKITRSLLQEKLGDEMIDINSQAEKLSRTALADHVAEEE